MIFSFHSSSSDISSIAAFVFDDWRAVLRRRRQHQLLAEPSNGTSVRVDNGELQYSVARRRRDIDGSELHVHVAGYLARPVSLSYS